MCFRYCSTPSQCLLSCQFLALTELAEDSSALLERQPVLVFIVLDGNFRRRLRPDLEVVQKMNETFRLEKALAEHCSDNLFLYVLKFISVRHFWET